MKITKQDIKTLNKIKKICNKSECKDCIFNINKSCMLQNQPNWWETKYLEEE